MVFLPSCCGLASALLFALPRAMGIAVEVGLNGKAAALIWQIGYGRLRHAGLVWFRSPLRSGADWPAMAGLPGDRA